MKNQASAKEKGRGSNNIISHGEFNLGQRSLWLIIFIAINAFLEKDVMPMEQKGRLSMEEWDELIQDLFKRYP